MDIRNNKHLRAVDGVIRFRQVSYRDLKNVRTIGTIIVTEEMVNRPHAVSFYAYDGKIDNIDYICIFNGIKDPYLFPLGKILKIPNESDMNSIVIKDNRETFKSELSSDSINKGNSSSSSVKTTGGRIVYTK